MKFVVISDHSTLGLGYLATAYFSYYANSGVQCSLSTIHQVDDATFQMLERVLVEDNLLLEKPENLSTEVGDPQVLILIETDQPAAMAVQSAPRVYYVRPEQPDPGLSEPDRYRQYREEIKREILRIIGKEELVR